MGLQYPYSRNPLFLTTTCCLPYPFRYHSASPASSPLASFVMHIPDALPSADAAPLLCAGITVYSPMVYYGLNKPGLKLGVLGLGGERAGVRGGIVGEDRR